MDSLKPIHVTLGGGKAVHILGIPMLIQIHGRDTGGVLSVVESRDSPGGGPPPHVHHREDETFRVLEGKYEFFVDGRTIEAGPGTILFAPRGIPHTYRCIGDKPGKLSVTLTPSGFESFFEEVGAMTAAEQQNIPRVIELGKKYGLDFLPPPGTTSPEG